MEQVVSAGSMRLMDFGVLGIFAAIFLTIIVYLIYHLVQRLEKNMQKWDEILAHERAEHLECRKELHVKLDSIRNKIDVISIQKEQK
jgi:hypothetical protein